MALVVMGAEHPIGQNIVRLARNDGHKVMPVYHAKSVPAGAEKPHVVADTDSAKEVARSINDGDTVVLVLGGVILDRFIDITDRLHATLAAILGRNIRLVVLDSYLPDISGYSGSMDAANRTSDVNLRQFYWADDIKRFATQNRTAVTILRSGPVYGAAIDRAPFGSGFWRKIMQGRVAWTIWSVDTPRFLCPVEEVSEALYKVSVMAEGDQGTAEELHLPSPDPVTLASLVAFGAQTAKNKANVRQVPRLIRRCLAYFSDTWRNTEDLGIRAGKPDEVKVQAFMNRVQFAHAGHDISVANTIHALRALA